MANTPTTTIRLHLGLKYEANKMFDSLGLSLSDAVTVFLDAVTRGQGIPFSMNIRPDDTRKTK